MVNHCAVGGCNNRAKRDTSSRRNFLLFHIVPKDPLRRAAWDKRINRADEDLKRLQTVIEYAAITSTTAITSRMIGSIMLGLGRHSG